MALFGTIRDVRMFKGVATELVHDVITQQIGYYKVILPNTPPNVYGEALVKDYIGPVLLNCLIERGDFHNDLRDLYHQTSSLLALIEL